MGRYPPDLDAKYRDASVAFAKELEAVDHLPEHEARLEVERLCKLRGVGCEKAVEALTKRRKAL